YLMYLVENGVISGALATAYIGRAIFQSLSNTRMSDMEMVFLSASVGYLIHSIFESFIFNVGNSGSLLFIFWLVYARKLMRNGKVL
ncbi:MAG: hypothetical protein JW745_07185, partial [Sedimentisphaerales bacterium]|nr:hypothetical protein [Sedimentisphaerales bacterium]